MTLTLMSICVELEQNNQLTKEILNSQSSHKRSPNDNGTSGTFGTN